MISVENLQARISGEDVLKGVEIHLKPGDTYGLLGPNGAGKSTTIFVLLGLRSRSGGRVSVFGKDPKDHAIEIRRSLGVMPERSGFYDWMTAPSYLQWYAKLYGCSAKDKDIRELLESVGLGENDERPIGSYSKGMKQRLAIGRALVSRPKLLILDEPTSGLDPKGRREIHDLLRNFANRQGTGVLLCTHLLDDVDRLCTRIGIVHRGRTLLEGLMSELLAQRGAGGRYRIRVERLPDTPSLPAGITLLAKEGDWLRLQVQADRSQAPFSLWEELQKRGWRILEIRSEASGLENLYLNLTDQAEARFQEKAI